MLSKSTPSISHLLIGSAAFCSLLVTMCGCDQISGNPIVQIIGEVRMDRKPLADTMVTFIPLELRGGNGKITELAYGKTDDTGKFELRTSEAKGVLPGEYRILFFRSPSKAQAKAIDQIDGANGEIESRDAGSEVTSNVPLMLAAIDGFSAFAETMGNRLGKVNVGGVPVAYNIKSDLRLTVKSGAGIIYPKFELSAHPKN